MTTAPVILSPPAAPGAFPDPFVLPVAGAYLAFATNGGGRNVRVRASGDLRVWEERPDALPRLPSWTAPGRTWSPSVLRAGERYVLWYAAADAASGRQAIGVATSDAPAGPYQPAGQGPAILQADEGGSIDPSPFVDGDGTAYLFWKADANAIRRRPRLYGAPLDAGGTRLAARPAPLLDCDRPWEGPVIEAPCLARAGERYLLFYSANRWQTAAYAIGYAVADHPLGPWTKLTTDRPWAASEGPVAGPGGQEVFSGPDGGSYLAYHAWDAGAVGVGSAGRRSLRIGRLDLTGGVPGLAPLDP